MASNANMGVSVYPVYPYMVNILHTSHMLLKLQDNTLQCGAHIQSNCCQAQTDSKAETVSGPAHAETLVTVLSLFLLW